MARTLFLLVIAANLLAGCAVTPAHQGCFVAEPYINGRYSGACDAQQRAHGYGTSVGIDRYTGEFSAGVIQGWGRYTWSNGAMYCGQFQQGDINGLGIYTDANGNRREGVWQGTELVQVYAANRLRCTIP